MLYLLNKDVRTVRWNGEPLHEVTSAIVKEIMNGDFTLTVKYPISDSGIYQLIQEDMLIKAPTPVLGAQLFRIKKPVEYNDHLEITAYHISDDVMQRSITPVSVTSQSCGMTLSRMVQNTKTALGDFSFNSDIQDRRTFNTTETETLYSILLDGKHSIVGTWGGELVRDNFAMTVKKSRGENRGVVITTHKNLKNYQRTKNSQNVVTRIHAKSTFKPEGAEKETTIRVTVDSPLINSYPYINEKEYENNNAKTVEELQKWAQSKFSNEGIDKVSDAIKIQAYELDGQVVHMGDTVNLKSWKHNVDAFKKAIAYEFDALKEEYISLTFDDKAGIGGSRASGGLSSAADTILGVTESAQEIALEKALQNADLDFDHKAGLLRQEISDDIELAKARAEEVKRELSDTINQRFNSFDNGPLKETKRKAEEALRNAGASTLLAQEAKRIGLDSVARLEAFKSQTTSAQTALSGDLDALKRTIANDIRPKQAQAEAEIAKQVEALSRTKNELAGASTLLAQEAKRIELDSVARLEAFKSQTTSAQTALSGDLDVLKQTIANDIRPKQAQAEAEIAKQVEALSRTKNELAGVKSAQATYKETTTRRLSELTNLANGKASKSELTQTAEELASRIASVQASGRNLFLNSLFKQDISKTGIWTTSTYTATIDSESKYLGYNALKIIGLNPSGRDGGNPKVIYPALGQFGKVIPGSTTNQDVTISFYAKANKNGIMLRSRLGNIGYKTGNVTLSTEIKRYVVHIPKGWTNESKQTTNEWLFNFNQEGTIWIWMPKFEISDVDTSYSEAPEDIEGQISTVESTFKQRANSLEAGVSRLTEGLRTKVDISALNVTAENIRQSVKSLETDTQNKLNQKLSQAEFEVRAGSIRQEILNVTKDKASKSELTQTAEELSSKIASVQVGGINLLRNTASLLIGDRSKGCWMSASGGNGRAISVEVLDPPKKMIKNMIRVIENTNGGNKDLTQLVRLRIGEKYTISCYARIASDSPNANVNLLFRSWANNTDLNRKFQKSISHKNWQKYSFTFTADAIENSIQFGQSGAGIIEICAPKIESGTLATDYSEAPEDIEGQISTVESTFKQRADSLDAGVRSLTEGLRTKADISSLNVTAENIRQSVKSLETDTQNKLNQKLSQAEFEVRADSIRQEILNATKDKASKSELTQTAEELASRIASVQASGRNLFLNSLFKQDISKTGIWTTSTYTATIDSESKYLGHNALKIIGLNPSGRDGGNPKVTYPALGQFGKVIPGSTTNQDVTISFYAKANKNGIMLRSRLGNIGYKTGNVTLSTEIKRYVVHIPKGWTNESKQTTNEWLFNFNQEGTVWIWMPKFEISDVDTSYSEAPEDIEGQISTVESTFKQRANSLDAGVNRLTEGLRTKADISSLNVTAENIRQSVKSLETDTQNKLNQKLSQAEFEVRAGSIRQEILNATKDKADKTLVVSEAGKLREEFSKMKVGGRNLWIKSKTVGAVIEKLPENHVTGQKECYRLENNSTLTFNLEPDFSSRLYQKVTFSAWIKYENVVQGRNFWNVFNCFKHYLFRKNSETGVQSGPDYATLGMYKGSADWKYITFTYDYSEKTNFDQLKTSLRFNLEGATSGTAWVTGIKVEIGSVATDWSPAPEDADGLITEAKATFERTAQGLRTDLSAIQEYVNKDGQRQEALQRYTREESTRQATAVRELVNRDFVGKATYQEDVKGINQRIEAVKTSANKDIASQIASYRQSVDGKFTDISSQITTYKQDVGGQISGLSNRLTSSEQGTTTQISNISNRINSNKQGTDNQISNLKTQVATNKDNAERQMGRISDQVSANKANADSQFANVTNQLARKVETTDFQRVKETSKLYERILGNTENGIADKVARMALTNQLFQVEVGKYSVSGPNLIKNSDFKNATNEWGSTQNLGRLVKHSFYHNGQKDLMRLSNATKNENFLYSHRFNLERNTDYVLNFRGFNNSALASYDVYILGRRAGESDGFTIVKKVVSSKKLSTSRCEDVSVTFNSGEMDNAYIRFDNNGSSSGTADLYITEVDLYKGYKPRTWQPHPEDAVADANKKLEATQTKMTQLAGSWAVQNINSAGDIISGINLGANGHNRFVGKLTHITGETLIDRAVIKSAMVDKLKTGNFEAGSVTTTILDAEAVTAEKLKVDNALIKKLTANDAFIDQLISKRIFSIKVESVISSSTFLEAYQGRIGGFTLGQFDQGGGRWISGVNQFSVGMGNGAGYGVRTAFWANWGNNWNYAGPKAWNVNTDGKMYCRNEVGFYDQVDFSNSSRANFYGNTTFSRSPVFSNGIELGSKDVLGDGWNPKGGRNAVVWWNQVGSGSVKYWMEQKSDRRLKENITDTAVKALDKINRLRMVAFDFIENKKHEEIGLIAQEAETIVPKIVSRDPENPDGYLHIDYTALVPYLIKAIQELNQKIEKMEKTIA
ncbi:TPA: tail fiber domain-containing protein [Streptococcus pneumoniae]|uniref:phage tail spike protein n=16 Tax=Streptococcus pneumoniae TaxID=1313 RepID=UPI000DFFAF30|nr:phage tail spike protein [Streptococcus pneumoniae]MDY6733949.1 phage tail spike protein [Streptococcus pneumoniae]SUO21072.1 phage hyaluronidase [Streptococcus pneumoniae]HET1419538.1 tail fiber domain-containing protein [Streptococcus pneumoniae]HEU6327251.1 tail fiber domain-containing protein [Streptococcus pneumoniae]HEU6337129.1 tail fiber domain-containing protein [Streptococcus pneumoniae]